MARYRVVSEDGHPVGRRTAFRVRPPVRQREHAPTGPAPGADRGPPAPSMGATAESTHEELSAGGVTDLAFAAARGTGYLAIALATGGAVFLLVIWLPAIARMAGAGAGWRTVSALFVAHLRIPLVGTVALGMLATELAIVLEGATAAGISFWAALDLDVVESVSEIRAVQAWGMRFAVWAILGAIIVAALRPHRAPVLRRAALGADGAALGPAPTRPLQLALLSALVALAATAPAAGHTGTYSPSGLLISADTLHVLSMGAWLGGLAMLLVVVPRALRALSPVDRTPLLAVVVGRFSRLAMIAVAVLLLSGAVQSVAGVGSVPALVETAYGRLVLAKILLFLGLITLGAYNQRRLLPRLRLLASGGEQPDRAAALLRRSTALEVGFAAIVLSVTSVLVVAEPVTRG
ncbi:MAG: copper resistance D family protein [Solirubrobacteraceae bacterium]